MALVPIFQGLVGMMFGFAERMFLVSNCLTHNFNCFHHNFSSRQIDSFNNANAADLKMRLKSGFRWEFNR
jgi:hypothetical protein